MEQLEEHVCRLKAILANAGAELQADLAQTILQRALNDCEHDAFEEKILKNILPQIGASLLKIVETSVGQCTTGEEDTVADEKTLDDTRRNVLRCEELLNLCHICINRIVNVGQRVPANSVRSLLDTLPEAIEHCFKHCKTSWRAYEGCRLERSSNELENLFRTTNATLRLFLKALEEDVIVFDTDVQSETELLAKVVSTIGTIVTMVNGMDLKTYVETIKSFGRLALKHHRSVCRVSPESVNVHLRYLARSARLALSELEESDTRAGERTLKSVNLIAKVVEKLIAVYGEFATTETFYSIVELLLQMYRCCQSCWMVANPRFAAPSAEPLLSKVFDLNGSQLKKAFFEYGTRCDLDNLAYHSFTLAIMRKVCAAFHPEWTVDSNSIIDVAFANINCLHKELCCGNVQIPFAYDLEEELRPIAIYDGTLILICRLIAKVSPPHLRTVELSLMKHTLSGEFWPTLLSLDIWSFVGRLASTELCANYVKYFSKIYAMFEKEDDRVETVALGNLIERFFSLLPNDAKHAVVEHLQCADLRSWIPPLRHLPDQSKRLLRARLPPSDDISMVFTDLREKSHSRHWIYLTRLFRAAGKLRCSADYRAIDVSLSISNILANTIESYDEREAYASADMISVLSNVSRATVPSDQVFLSMLQPLIAVFPLLPSHVAIRIAFQMRDDVDSLDHYSPQVANALAELTSSILDEKNPIVFQEGLESFHQLINMCPDESFIRKIANAVTSKPPWVTQLVRAYMSNAQCCELQGYTDVNAYICQLVSVSEQFAIHTCYNYDGSRKDEKCPKIDENSDLDQRVGQICHQLNQLTSHKSTLSADAMRKLRTAISKLVD